MRLTQEEARKWGKVLTGFAEGKRYYFPLSYKNATTVNHVEITDFKHNQQPTLEITYGGGNTLINIDDIREMKV